MNTAEIYRSKDGHFRAEYNFWHHACRYQKNSQYYHLFPSYLSTTHKDHTIKIQLDVAQHSRWKFTRIQHIGKTFISTLNSENSLWIFILQVYILLDHLKIRINIIYQLDINIHSEDDSCIEIEVVAWNVYMTNYMLNVKIFCPCECLPWRSNNYCENKSSQ